MVCWEARSLALLSNAPFPSPGKYPQVQFSVLTAPSKSNPVCEQPFLRKMQHSQLSCAGILHSLRGPSTHTMRESREKSWTGIPHPCRIQMPLVFYLVPGQLDQIHAATPMFAECFYVRFVWLSKFSRNSFLAFFWVITSWRLCSSRFFHDLQPHP